MKKIIFNNKEDLYNEVSKIYIKELNEKKNLTLGLATGSSPIGLYDILIKSYENGEISFKDVSTFNLDEYVNISKENVQSYSYFMYKHLFNHIDINKDNIHIPNSDPNKINEYENELSKNNIDIQLLGIGSNGHIAFNEPGTPFDTRTHKVRLAEETINDNSRFFEKIEDVPTEAITMGLANLMEAKKIILIAIGESKADIIKELFKDDNISTKIPASILKNHQDVTFYLDSDAASKLNN